MTSPFADSLFEEERDIESTEKPTKIDQIKERLSIDNISLYLVKIDSLERAYRSQ